MDGSTVRIGHRSGGILRQDNGFGISNSYRSGGILRQQRRIRRVERLI
jgi:hypothetical protein